MTEETGQELIAAIRALQHAMQVQAELVETLSARQADLIAEMKVLRTVMETSG